MSEKSKHSNLVQRREFMTGLAGGTVSAVLVPKATSANIVLGATKDQKVKVGVVGGGFGRSFYWHKHPNSQVTAVCDLREDRLQAMVETFGTTNAYKDFRTFLREGEMDAVAVFTPAPLHVWMSKEAMMVGKHVISAVPAAMSIEECEELIECVKSTGLNYMMAETSYYRREIITCREWAEAGKFGTIHYAEAEYHHEGLLSLMYDERHFPTWRQGFPPMHYPTHCTGMVIPVMKEYLTNVQAIGWGDEHEALQTNPYENPFWNTTGFFRTSGGHSCRISVFWHVAAGGTERASFYGDRLSYIMNRPEGSGNSVFAISENGETVLGADNYPQGKVSHQEYQESNHYEKLPAELRVPSGHGGSHTFLTNEFINSIVEGRRPVIDVYEAVNYTVPGIVAHQSALKEGEPMAIPTYAP